MNPETTLTVGLVVFSIGLTLAGWRAAWWITNFATKLRTSISTEIAAVMKAVDSALKDQREKQRDFERETREGLRAIERDFAAFKLDVAKNYATKGDIEASTKLILAELKASRYSKEHD